MFNQTIAEWVATSHSVIAAHKAVEIAERDGYAYADRRALHAYLADARRIQRVAYEAMSPHTPRPA